MSRNFAVVAVAVALLPGGGSAVLPVQAQEPVLMAPTHPYLAVARGNAYRWRLQRIAARFNYNPYFPQLAAYTPHRMPFADAERYAQRSLMGPYARSAYGYQLAELASEYEYFGLADVVEDLGHR